MRRNRFILLLAIAVYLPFMHGQMVSVTGSLTSDSTGKLATGTITFSPVFADGSPASYRRPGGGQVTVRPVTVNVVSGVFSIQLPDVTLTNPPAICFTARLHTTDGSGFGPGYDCLQPHATATYSGDWCQNGVCDFDAYSPSLPGTIALPPLQGPPDMLNLWNSMVSQYKSTGGTVTPIELVDAGSITWVANNPSINVATLPLYTTPGPSNNCGPTTAKPCVAQPDGISVRTLNLDGLTPGARFAVLINPMGSQAGAQAVYFGSGCTWQFSPANVVLSGNLLQIPAWANWTYMAVFFYDGANCIGTVVN